MKKKIAILATLMLALVGIFSFALPGIAQEGTASAGKVYLVPGIYYDAGVSGGKAYNTIDVGAEKLTAEQEAEIFVENVYLAGETGSLLPEPSSDRPDWSSMVGGTRWMRRSFTRKPYPTRGQKMYFCMLTGGMTFLSRPIPFPRRQGMRKKQCATICASRTATAMLNT